MEEIFKIYIHQANCEDKKFWPHMKNGQLSTKLAYKVLVNECNNLNSGRDYLHWKNYWKIKLLLKIIIFWWEYLNNSIADNALSNSKMTNTSSICLLCKSHDETIEHAFFNCNRIRAT